LSNTAVTADVLYVASSTYLNNASVISVEDTRAGYFLNLKPLVDTDTDLNPDDYLPVSGKSTSGIRGSGRCPSPPTVCVDVQPIRFDNAKLPYPTDQWTLDDLSNAVRQLAVKTLTAK